MARTTATVSFQAIELKGSLLPGSLLEQVARLQAPMQKEADYGLAKGERLREQIDAAWVRLKEIWEEYRDLRERAAQSTAGLHLAQRLQRLAARRFALPDHPPGIRGHCSPDPAGASRRPARQGQQCLRP